MRRILAALLFVAAAVSRAQTQPATAANDAAVAANAGAPISFFTVNGTPTDGQVVSWQASTSSAVWANAAGGGGGAPTTSKYWLGAADGSLTNGVDLSALSTAVVVNTGGVPSAMSATTCTNQVITALSAVGAGTCASVSAAMMAASSVDVSTSVVTGTLAAGRFPALTGPVTTSAGSLATTVALTTSTDGGTIIKQATTPGTQQTSANINVNGTIIEEKDALATTPTGGYTAQNTTAAANGAQQVSPPFSPCGQGWGTTGSTNETDCWRIYTLPIQGTTSTASLKADVSLAGGAYANEFTLTSAGTLTIGGGLSAGGNISTNSASGTISLTGGLGAGVGGFSELTGQGGTMLLTGQSQLMTLSTGSTLTTSTGTLLPAGAIIYAVVGRVTTAITTAASYSIGSDTPSNASRFCSTGNGLTLGTTFVCLNQVNCGNTTCSATNGMAQTAAGNVTITTNANPGAGAIRIQVYYFLPTPPTS